MLAEKKSGGDTGWDRVASASAVVGEWVQLSGSYSVPSVDKLTLYVEASDKKLEYYIDSFTVSE